MKFFLGRMRTSWKEMANRTKSTRLVKNSFFLLLSAENSFMRVFERN